MESAILIDSVTRIFGETKAVDKLSFSVHRDEIFGLLGPNGAGKTTTLNLIVGLLKRHHGQINVLGHDPQTDPHWVHRQVGLVPQETNVYLDLNAMDNLWHHAALYCDDLSQVKRDIETLLKLVNLWERRKDPVSSYSGGMKRRLVLARVLLHKPQIILFDEPTLGVDVQGRHVIWDHIIFLRSKGVTFIISTNDMSEAEALCDRLVIIDYGKAIALDTPEQLKTNLERDILRLRTTPPIDNPKDFFRGIPIQKISEPALGELQLEVTDAESHVGDLINQITKDHRIDFLSISRPTLDDVFLHHTGRVLRE